MPATSEFLLRSNPVKIDGKIYSNERYDLDENSISDPKLFAFDLESKKWEMSEGMNTDEDRLGDYIGKEYVSNFVN